MRNQQQMIRQIRADIVSSDGSAAIERFPSLRAVDAKVREFWLVLENLPDTAAAIKKRFNEDDDFQANSRRVRLEALANYCQTVLHFLEGGILDTQRKPVRGPSFVSLTGSMPMLEEVIQRRWIEAQICWFGGAYLAGIVLMGSIMEALLLSRVLHSPADAGRASCAPKDRTGATLKFHEWKLSQLIDVAVELRRLKLDRGKFSHALRESRNIVHPYQEANLHANFDEGTCRTCWQVLNSAAEDLLGST